MTFVYIKCFQQFMNLFIVSEIHLQEITYSHKSEHIVDMFYMYPRDNYTEKRIVDYVMPLMFFCN